jgi:hypothetical protein
VHDELVQAIRERTGLDEAMASQVATVAIDFIKSKLPEPVASLLDGQAPDVGSLGNVLGGFFGQKSS